MPPEGPIIDPSLVTELMRNTMPAHGRKLVVSGSARQMANRLVKMLGTPPAAESIQPPFATSGPPRGTTSAWGRRGHPRENSNSQFFRWMLQQLAEPFPAHLSALWSGVFEPRYIPPA